MAGLLEPTEGTILYDGLDLKTLNYRDLRRQIGFVLQDCYVFADTIARNIAFGEEEPDMERVAWAAEVASAHEFIERLPFGYDTRIGETGLALSGGQRQRIAIARAIYHRPPILIFDEATSSLDAESERAVQHNIDALLEGRTAFVIAHRVSTVQNADLIVVLERGRLVEQGSHDALMQRRGLYYYLVSQQLGGGRRDRRRRPTRRFSRTRPRRGPRARSPGCCSPLFAAGVLGARARAGAGNGRRAVRARAGARRRSRAHAARRHRDGRPRGRRADGGIRRRPVHDQLRAGRRSHGRAYRARRQPLGRRDAAGKRAPEVREPAPSRRARARPAPAAPDGARVADGAERAPGRDRARDRRSAAAQLHEEGLTSWIEASKPRLEAERLAVELEEARAEAVETQAAVARLRFEMASRDAAFNEIARSVQEELERARARKGMLDGEASREGNALAVSAPCGGTIVKLVVKNAGTVVRSSDVLAEIACREERLQAELMVPQRGLALLRAGQLVKLRYDAFPYQRFGVRHATLRWISPSASLPSPGGVLPRDRRSRRADAAHQR